MTIAPGPPVETFCVFFERGFVEDAVAILGIRRRPPARRSGTRRERWDSRSVCGLKTARIDRTLRRMRELAASGGDAEAGFYDLALGLVELRVELAREIGRVPGARVSTRRELHARVQKGRQAMDEMLTENLPLKHIARLAHLSPFHFIVRFAPCSARLLTPTAPGGGWNARLVCSKKRMFQ